MQCLLGRHLLRIYSHIWNAGWDRFASTAPPSKNSLKLEKRGVRKNLRDAERVFSNSSVTSPATLRNASLTQHLNSHDDSSSGCLKGGVSGGRDVHHKKGMKKRSKPSEWFGEQLTLYICYYNFLRISFSGLFVDLWPTVFWIYYCNNNSNNNLIL